MIKFQKILMFIAAILFFSLALLSLVRFVFFPEQVGTAFRKKEATIAQAEAKEEKSERGVFSSIGQLRLSTEDADDFIVILRPYFFYPKSDTDFFEELVTKNQKMRFLITEYFSKKTKDYIISTKEANIKSDLLSILNEELVLGYITELYFDEYIFLD